MNAYSDPTTGEWVGEHETRQANGTVKRTTEWFVTYLEAVYYSRTGERRGLIP